MRATHPSSLPLPLLAAARLALNPLTAVASDLVFADSRTWTDVKIVSQEPRLTVFPAAAVRTVHAAYLAPACMLVLKLILPDAGGTGRASRRDKPAAYEAANRQAQTRLLEAEQAMNNLDGVVHVLAIYRH